MATQKRISVFLEPQFEDEKRLLEFLERMPARTMQTWLRVALLSAMGRTDENYLKTRHPYMGVIDQGESLTDKSENIIMDERNKGVNSHDISPPLTEKSRTLSAKAKAVLRAHLV